MPLSTRLRWLPAAALAAACFVTPLVLAAQQVPPPPPPPPPAGAGAVTITMGADGSVTTSTAVSPLLPTIAQWGTGLIGGRVVDAGTGRPVQGAVVEFGGVQALQTGVPTPAAASERPPVPRVLTDAEGRFVFRNLPAGMFLVRATKAGFADGASGRARPAGADRWITLADGERRTDVAVRLFRHAALSGTVIDDLGEPAVGVQIRAFRRNVVAGHRSLTAHPQTAMTDDRGMYRLGNLVPGEYVVCALFATASAAVGFSNTPDFLATVMAPGSSGYSVSSAGTRVSASDRFVLQSVGSSSGQTWAVVDAAGRVMTYASVCHPNAASPSGASPITLGAGVERRDVDLALQLVPAVNIGGTVVGPEGPAANYVLHLVPSDTGDLSADPAIATAITASDGTFLFLGVPAGSYVIQTVRVPRAAAQAGRGAAPPTPGAPQPPGAPASGPGAFVPLPSEATLWTALPVTVGRGDITDLSVVLQRGSIVSGRVEFEGAAERPAPDALARIAILVEPADGKPRANVTAGRIAPDGRFATQGFPAGRYLVRIPSTSSGWVLKSVMAGGTDISDTPVELSGGDLTNVVITFSDRISRLSGTVRGVTAADDAPAVVVFPADSDAWRNYGITPRRVRLVRASASGEFTFTSLPAGTYHLAAIDEEATADWQDPRILAAIARQATVVTLGEGAEVVQQIERIVVRPPSGGPAAVATVSPHEAPYQARGRAAGGTRDDFRPATGDSDRDTRRAAADVDGDAGDVRPTGPFAGESVETGPSPSQVRDARTALPARGTSSLAGVVRLDDMSGAPVRRAVVTARAGDPLIVFSTFTDETGRWRIDGLPAGRYTMTAAKPAHVTTYYGSTRPGRGPGSAVALVEGGRVEDLVLRMPRGAVIAGTVTNEAGEPIPNSPVRAYRIQMVGGERRLVFVATSSGAGSSAVIPLTDDRGAYRLYGLPEGAYFVSVGGTAGPSPFPVAPNQGGEIRPLTAEDLRALEAGSALTPPPPATGSVLSPTPAPAPAAFTPMGGRPVGFAPVYHPSAVMVDEAAPVVVSTGQEVHGVDVLFRLVPTSVVRGRVTDPEGRPPASVRLTVVATESGGVALGGFSSSGVTTRPDGTFVTNSLAPGRYTLSARGSPEGRPTDVPISQMPLFADLPIEVRGDDVHDVVLVLAEGVRVRGQVTFEGTTTAPDASTVRVNLSPTNSSRMGAGIGSATPAEDGGFVLEHVPPGEYRASALASLSSAFVAGSGQRSPWGVKAIRYQGRDLVDDSFEIVPGRDVDGLVVVFTDAMPELSGTLTDTAGRPVPDLTIVLFSTDRRHWRPGSRRVAAPVQPDSEGRFVFTPLAPGEYYLAAVAGADRNDLTDHAFLEEVAAGAIKVTVGESGRTVQDIRIAGGW